MVHEGKVLIAIRPESLLTGPFADRPDMDNVVTGTVIAETFLGNFYDYRIQLANNQRIRVQGSRSHQNSFKVGESVRLFVAPEDTWVIPN
jgi:ABC-type Fe3+/spermidine/putrescine transport system ATPase subunit